MGNSLAINRVSIIANEERIKKTNKKALIIDMNFLVSPTMNNLI